MLVVVAVVKEVYLVLEMKQVLVVLVDTDRLVDKHLLLDLIL